FKVMKYLVTGGAGFIGGHVAARLLNDGGTVVIIDCLKNNYNPQMKLDTLNYLKTIPTGNLFIYSFSLSESDCVRKIFETYAFDAILHLAAHPGVRASVENPMMCAMEDVPSMALLLECAHQFKVPHFVYASSSAVYGGSSKAPFSENDTCDRPVSPYGALKRACELLGHSFADLYGMPVTCLRFFTVFGPRCRPDMATFKFIDLIWKGKPIPMYGDGSSRRAFTFISDIVNGIISTLRTPSGYRIINLGGEKSYTLSQFISAIERCLGKKAIIQQYSPQAGDVLITSADQTVALAELNFRPTVSLEEGLKLTFEWYLNFVEAKKENFQMTESNVTSLPISARVET
ncbi:putative Protein CapI, partial [Cardiosporidium cionae]